MPAAELEIRQLLMAAGKPAASEVDELVARGRRGLLARGEPLTREGDLPCRAAFIHRGIVRYHVHHPVSGDDITKDFGFAGEFAVSYGSALQGKPARRDHAVEDCVLTTWAWADFIAAFGRNLEWERMRRAFAERMYVRKEDHSYALMPGSGCFVGSCGSPKPE